MKTKYRIQPKHYKHKIQKTKIRLKYQQYKNTQNTEITRIIQKYQIYNKYNTKTTYKNTTIMK